MKARETWGLGGCQRRNKLKGLRNRTSLMKRSGDRSLLRSLWSRGPCSADPWARWRDRVASSWSPAKCIWHAHLQEVCVGDPSKWQGVLMPRTDCILRRNMRINTDLLIQGYPCKLTSLWVRTEQQRHKHISDPKCWARGKYQLVCWVLRCFRETCKREKDVVNQISFCFLKKKKRS